MTVVQILYSGLGGHSSVAFSLIEADKKKEFDYVMLFYGIEGMPAAYIDKCKALGIKYFFIKKQIGFDNASQRNVIAVLKKIRPTVVLLHSMSLIIPVFYYSLFHKTRIISVEHQPNHLKTKLEWVWSFLLMIFSKRVVFLTELYRDQIRKKLGFFFNERKSKVINNGININLFKPGERPRPADTAVIKIGMLARLMDTKDHLTLIRAFKLLMENKSDRVFELHIAGDGEMKPTLMNLTRECGLESDIHFRGMIPEAAAVDFLNELDIYIHASLGETMSTSLIQVMACRKPIIASDVTGINNMLRNNVMGILVPAKNENAMAGRILQLVNDPAMAKELAKNAFNFAVEHYSNEKMLENYKTIFVN